MSSFPEHESNLKRIERLNLGVSSVDLDDDPYNSWDYDTLTYLVDELIDIIEKQQSKLSKASK